MSRILAIDYGKKRTGIAVTDILQIIANGLTTVPTTELTDFLMDYIMLKRIHILNALFIKCSFFVMKFMQFLKIDEKRLRLLL